MSQRPYYQQTYGYGTSPYSQVYSPNSAKGKWKLDEVDFDAAFASFDQELKGDDLSGLEEAFGKQTLEDKGKNKMVDNDVINFQRSIVSIRVQLFVSDEWSL
jgi:hypothetical protein